MRTVRRVSTLQRSQTPTATREPGAAVAEGVRALPWTGDRTVPAGFESHCGKLRFVILAILFCLCQAQCLSEEMLGAICGSARSMDHAAAAQSMDSYYRNPWIAQESVDPAARSMDFAYDTI